MMKELTRMSGTWADAGPFFVFRPQRAIAAVGSE
jgi:hypothetical protein